MGQIARELAGVRDEHSPEEVLSLLETHVSGTAEPSAVAANVGQLLGVAGGSATAEDTARAIAAFLAAGARERPLVVIVDDIQWAEPTLLDLLAGLPSALSDGAGHGSRAGPSGAARARVRTGTRRCGSSPSAHGISNGCSTCVLGRAPAALRARLAAASGGNPLFLEELVAMLA